MTSGQTYPRRRGVSLIEAVLVLTVFLGVVASGIVYFGQTRLAARSVETARAAVGLSAQIRGLYDARSNFSGLSDATVIAAGLTPPASIGEGGITNAFGGRMTVFPADMKGLNDVFVIEVTALERQACARLGLIGETGSGPLGTGLAGLAIMPRESPVILGTSADPIGPDRSGAICSATGNAIQAVYTKSMDGISGDVEIFGLRSGE